MQKFSYINFWQYVAHGKFCTSSLKYITKSNILPYSVKSLLINPLNYEDSYKTVKILMSGITNLFLHCKNSGIGVTPLKCL